MAEPLLCSPLSHRSDVERQAGLSIALSEVSNRGMIDLRGEAGNTKFMAAVKATLKVELPSEPRTSVSQGDVTVLWLSVDQWLVTCSRDKTAKTLEALRKKTEGMFAAVCDMSDARAIIRLTGDGAREVLMKGTSADLLAPDIVAGTVRRMLFAEIAAACHIQETAPDKIDLYVFRSYADYVWAWLLATARSGARIQLFGPQDLPPA